tara:strand:+ start:112 stop:966 length:855 start_codon:yes stop_codon:yes gene_type:complete
MKEMIFELSDIRMEISFKSIEELRLILSFYKRNNLYKINIPSKNNLNKDLLLRSIEISKKEFPNLDLIPHFSVLHEFKRNRFNTLNSFIHFLHVAKGLGCKEVLLVSGSQIRTTLNSVSTLSFLKDHNLFLNSDLSIGVAFNPYLPSYLFEEEIIKLEKKFQSGLVSSVWIQFGTDCSLLECRIEMLRNLLMSAENKSYQKSKINLFGSILIPSKQFLARFKYRPWKGVYCSPEFLESVDFANNFIVNLFKIYKKNQICPIIETNLTSADKLIALENILNNKIN